MLWLPWLTLASYFFYGWWNPYYLFLVFYSTVLDFSLVALMDHCPREGQKVNIAARLDAVANLAMRVLKARFPGLDRRGAGNQRPGGVRPARHSGPRMAAFGLIVLLMGLGALYSSRRIWLLISLVNNLALLLFFKYARFVVENLNAVAAWLHSPFKLADPSTLMPLGFDYLLPVGISFFTFQSLSYTIDFYFGNVHRERNFLRFATFVCFFPQLMAGPIERARHLLPQFNQFPPVRLQNFTDGASLFLVGLFKKLALANYLSFYVERVYDNPKDVWRSRPGAGHGRFRLADLLRFQRLHRHGPGRGEVDGLPSDLEFQQSLPRDRVWASFGRAGTSACRAGSGIMCTFPWGAIGRGSSTPTAISSSRSLSPAFGTARPGRLPSGARCTAWEC